jgi:hypothetical protein
MAHDEPEEGFDAVTTPGAGQPGGPHLTLAAARREVAALLSLQPEDFQACRAPAGSVHDGAVYVMERDFDRMSIDDSVWIVSPSGRVDRGIPVGHPLGYPPSPLI